MGRMYRNFRFNGLMFGKNSKYCYKILKIKEREQTELAEYIKLGCLEMLKYIC